MHRFLFFAGPPAGKALWDPVLARVRDQGGQATAIDLLDLSDSGDEPESWAEALAAHMAPASSCVLVAHGAAVPLARQAAAIRAPAGLALSNGPLGPLSKSARTACAALSGPGGAVWSRASVALPWLASSTGLRRTVVNPYVWDRDTVVAICGPLFETNTARRLTRRYLAMLPNLAEQAANTSSPTALFWGSSDPFFQPSTTDLSESDTRLFSIDGGHHYHPLERPWEIADAVMTWARETLTTT